MKAVFKNKVVWYVGSRYFVYGLQFVSLILLAEKLGPYNYGIWGFILLLMSYMRILNLGIASSVNVYLIQYKNDIVKVRDFICSSFGAAMILIFGLIVFAAIHILNPSLFGKYNIGALFYLVIVIGALQYLNTIWSNIYRARNYLFEVAFYQSVLPIIIFLNVIFAPVEYLIECLVYGYLIGNIGSFLLFVFRKGYPSGGRIKFDYVKDLIKKGLYLFLYNSAFYLILTTTSSFVSHYYSVEQYGYYSFSYTLGHSILLLMEAFAFIIYPKVIDKLYTGTHTEIEKILKSVRINYISLSHGLMYVAMAFFPLLINFFPKFQNSLIMLDLMALAIILSTNAFGYNTLLIARNKEKLSAVISIISLCVNVIISIILEALCHFPYYLSIISIMGSYICFGLLCSWFSHKLLYNTGRGFVRAVFPINLVVPYGIAIGICLTGKAVLSVIPLVVFIILNLKTIAEIKSTFLRILQSSKIVNIRDIE